MPNTKQAAKRLRQNEKRKENNRARKTAIKTYTKKVLKAVEAKSATDAATHFVEAQKRLDKAAKSSTIHRNKAARRKSRLQKKINKIEASS